MVKDVLVILAVAKGAGRTEEKVAKAGHFRLNQSCEYYGITEETIVALVGYGIHSM